MIKKITSRKQSERKQKRNGIILGIILIGLMFFSVVGYSFRGKENEGESKITYNGFEFIKQNNVWVLNKQGDFFIFQNNPNQVEEIDSNLNLLQNYFGKPLYIFSENEQAILEIYQNLFNQNRIVERIQKACFNMSDCSPETPIKTCEDNFIIIKEGRTEITQQENCVFINGPMENLTQITDEFLFQILEIR